MSPPPLTANGAVDPAERAPLLRHGDVPSTEQNGYGIEAQEAHEAQGQQDADADGEPVIEEPDLKHLLPIVMVLWSCAFFAALDQTIVATLAGPIASDFDSFTLYSWLASAYLIANAASQPISGKLTDIFSRRTGLLVATISFAIGNLICGLAGHAWVMVLGRVISGLGGGGLQTVSVFTMSDLVPLRRRGLWQGYANVAFGLGMGLGGVFGGLLNDNLNWRWAFLIQVPFFLVIAVLVYFIINIPVRDTGSDRWKRVDFLGAFLLVTSMVLLLLGINTGGNQLPWTHPLVLSSIPLSAVILAAYVYVEKYVVPEPIIPIRLLGRRTVIAACFANWFASMVSFASLYFLPLFAQAKGKSASNAGLRQIPIAIGTSIGSLSSGYIMRLTGKYKLLALLLGSFTALAGLLFSTTVTFDTPDWLPYLYLGVGGVGYGGTLTVTIIAMLAAVDHKDQATITGASYAFRSTGSSIGITVASAVLQNILKSQLWDRFGDRRNAAEIIGKLRDDFSSLNDGHTVPESWKEGVMDSYMFAFRGVFITILGFGVLSLIFLSGLEEHKLHTNLARK